MLTIDKPTHAKCYFCGEAARERLVDAAIGGQTNTLCWKDVEKVFNSHAGVEKPKKETKPKGDDKPELGKK